MDQCPCGSGKTYAECCEPLIEGERAASTAEELMRSRYSAYTRSAAGYILETIHPDKREGHSEKSILKWANDADWLGLEILDVQDGGAHEYTRSTPVRSTGGAAGRPG